MKQPSLFPLTVRPTTRAIADAVRGTGASALPNAERKADDARYQEVRCRSALNHVKGMPFEWTLNPYRGCTHACHYCFARRYHKQFELDADDEFATIILVKTNLVEVLGKELARPRWSRALVAIGTATDPYQPIEGQYKLSRRSLIELAASRTPVNIITKGPMIVRDIDVLKDVAAASRCTVCMSVPSVDEAAWRSMEPGTAHPFQRLKAVQALTRAGVRAGVLMAPLLPGITTARHTIDATLSAIADHGASFVGANVLHLEGGTRDHFFRFLERAYPQLVDGYARLYANGAKRVPRAYADTVRTAVSDARNRVGMTARTRPDGGRDDGEDEEADGEDVEMRPEARDPVLWEAAIMEQ